MITPTNYVTDLRLIRVGKSFGAVIHRSDVEEILDGVFKGL
jgi:hypothetical protein